MKKERDWKAVEQDILNRLLDKYENSVTYRGKNKVKQRFWIRPVEVFPEYQNRFAPVELVEEFEGLLYGMAEDDLITVEWLGGGNENVQRILPCEEALDRYYEILGRKPLIAQEEEQMLFYETWLGVSTETDAFCQYQIARAAEGRKLQYNLTDAENLLKLWKYVLQNEREVMERELSVEVLGDSKLFETTYRSRLGALMEEFGDYDSVLEGLESKGAEAKLARCRALLEAHNVFRNPSYVYVKGPVELVFPDQHVVLNLETAMAFSSGMLEKLERVVVSASRVVTVENLTSFHRVSEPDTVYVYLGGYHNTVKQIFLRRMSEDNRGLQWFHFGDADPDGYYILKNLKERTGIPFEPLWMGVPELEAFSKYCKPLEQNDFVKANSLLESGLFEEELHWMLDHNQKLEQEIISWKRA